MTNLLLHTIAQSSGQNGGGGLGGLVFLVLWLAIVILIIAGMWKTFAKAGRPGWGCIIPIYNIYLLCRIAGRPGWWLILYFIPIVNIVVTLIVALDIAGSFGRSALFKVGLWLLAPIFFCILGFGGAQYQGPAAT